MGNSFFFFFRQRISRRRRLRKKGDASRREQDRPAHLNVVSGKEHFVLIWPVQRFVMSGTWRSEALREFFLFLALQERRRVPLVESLDRLRARRSKKEFLCLLKWSILLGLAGLACLGLSIVFSGPVSYEPGRKRFCPGFTSSLPLTRSLS
jgi:hypothetical protein